MRWTRPRFWALILLLPLAAGCSKRCGEECEALQARYIAHLERCGVSVSEGPSCSQDNLGTLLCEQECLEAAECSMAVGIQDHMASTWDYVDCLRACLEPSVDTGSPG